MRSVRPVEPVAYDPAWSDLFRKLASRLRDTVGDAAVSIEHVGSTAVPGLASKPIVDIDVVLKSESQVADVIKRLEVVGYQHEGDLGVSGREALLPPGDLPNHHLYVVVRGSAPYLNHIMFRDFLRDRVDAASDYEAVKIAAAKAHRNDRGGLHQGQIAVH